jgi:hypothetical protein
MRTTAHFVFPAVFLIISLFFVTFPQSSWGDPDVKRVLTEMENEAKFKGAALLAKSGFTDPHFLPKNAPTFFYQIHTDPEYGPEDQSFWKKRYGRYYYAASFLSHEGVDRLKLWTLEDAIWRALEERDPRVALERIAKSAR